MDLMTYLLCKRDGGGGGSGTTYTIATEGKKVTLTDADGNKQEITVPYATTAYSAQKIDGKNVPTLDSAGKIPTDYLPSYVDDVEEYPSIQDFPQTGEAGKVYVDTSSNKIYRWAGESQYVDITGGLPHCYDELTYFLENENIVFNKDEETDYNSFALNFIDLVLTGYSDIAVDRDGGVNTWGDTGNSGLVGAVDDICGRIATLEKSGSLPDCYEGLTWILQQDNIVFDMAEATGRPALILTGYTDIVTEKEGFDTWGDTGLAGLFDAVYVMCQRIAALESGGGGGNVADVYVNGVSVLDANNIAQLKGYVEVTQAEYDALPASKLTDGIPYYITDSKTGVADVKVNGVSIIDNNGVANITITDTKVTQESSGPSTYGDYRILLSKSDNDTEETDTVYKGKGLTYNPSSGQLQLMLASNTGMYFNAYDGEIVTRSQVNNSSREMSINGDDIKLYNSGNTWDGINTSLKDAISDIKTEISSISDENVKRTSQDNKSTDRSVLLGSSSEGVGGVYTTSYLEFNPHNGNSPELIVHNKSDATYNKRAKIEPDFMSVQSADSSASGGTQFGFLVTNSGANTAMAVRDNDIEIRTYQAGTTSVDQTWDGTNTSLKTAIADLQIQIGLLKELCPDGIAIEDNITLKVGDTVTIKSLIVPDSPNVTWTIDNQLVASVNDGVVTGLSAGTAIITARKDSGGQHATSTCVVTVTE